MLKEIFNTITLDAPTSLLKKAARECNINLAKVALAFGGKPHGYFGFMFSEPRKNDEGIREGNNAFDIAFGQDDLPMMELLLKHGYDPNGMICSEMYLSSAARKGDLSKMNILIANGANVNVSNLDPIRLAAQHRQVESVKFLLEHGAIVLADDPELIENLRAIGLPLDKLPDSSVKTRREFYSSAYSSPENTL